MNAEARRQLRARLFEAGATLSTGATGKRMHLTAWLPADTEQALVEIHADGCPRREGIGRVQRGGLLARVSMPARETGDAVPARGDG